MISIDTSKAFDTFDRQVMLQELRAAGVDANDIAVIMALHSHIGYRPCKTDAEARITSRRGVRQGCTLAPTLWVLITIARSKTQVIMAGRGRQFKLWRTKRTRKTKDGPRLVLWSEQGQSQQMPIVTSAT